MTLSIGQKQEAIDIEPKVPTWWPNTRKMKAQVYIVYSLLIKKGWVKNPLFHRSALYFIQKQIHGNKNGKLFYIIHNYP